MNTDKEPCSWQKSVIFSDFHPGAGLLLFSLLTLYCTHSNSLCKVFLETQEYDNNRNCCQCCSGHNQAEIVGHLAQLTGNTKRNGLCLILCQHNQLQRILIPGIDEGENSQSTKSRLDNGECNFSKGTELIGSVNSGCLQQGAWEYSLKTASSGIRRRAILQPGKSRQTWNPRHFLTVPDWTFLSSEESG